MHLRPRGFVAYIALALSFCIVHGCTREPDAGFVTSIPWGLTGRAIVIDTHTHTRFSDGSHSPLELASSAFASGCHALAVTDHNDRDQRNRSATPEYLDEIDEARAKVPGLIMFAALEWNIPPYRGREHVTLLVDPALERSLLPEFKQQSEKDDAPAGEALRWLAQQEKRPDDIVLIYNHPSRKDEDREENLRDYIGWAGVNNLFVGFEGGPGHQKAPSPGAYGGSLKTEGRWDPVVAEVGGTWDRLLDQGYQVWGAIAVSDYHNDQFDFLPCEFARTTVRVPSGDHRGFLLGLRAGSFWGGHGRVLDDLLFAAVSEGLAVPATPGEVVRLPRNARPVFRVKVRRGPGAKDLPLRVEWIGNGLTGAPTRAAARELGPGEDTADWQPQQLVAGSDGRTAYFRARVVAPGTEHGLVAYS